MARDMKCPFQVAGYPLLASLPELPELLLEEVPEELVLAELPEVEVLWDVVLWDDKLLAEELWDALLETLGAGL